MAQLEGRHDEANQGVRSQRLLSVLNSQRCIHGARRQESEKRGGGSTLRRWVANLGVLSLAEDATSAPLVQKAADPAAALRCAHCHGESCSYMESLRYTTSIQSVRKLFGFLDSLAMSHSENPAACIKLTTSTKLVVLP